MVSPSISLDVSHPKNISPTKNGGEKGLAYMTPMLKAFQKGQKKAAKSKSARNALTIPVVISIVNRNFDPVTRD